MQYPCCYKISEVVYSLDRLNIKQINETPDWEVFQYREASEILIREGSSIMVEGLREYQDNDLINDKIDIYFIKTDKEKKEYKISRIVKI